MRYTVVWLEDVENELARLWMGSGDRAAITAAANSIDNKLLNDPEDVGESREGDKRVLVVAPLTVVFRVKPDDRIVEVGAVHYRGKHR